MARTVYPSPSPEAKIVGGIIKGDPRVVQHAFDKGVQVCKSEVMRQAIRMACAALNYPPSGRRRTASDFERRQAFASWWCSWSRCRVISAEKYRAWFSKEAQKSITVPKPELEDDDAAIDRALEKAHTRHAIVHDARVAAAAPKGLVLPHGDDDRPGRERTPRLDVVRVTMNAPMRSLEGTA